MLWNQRRLRTPGVTMRRLVLLMLVAGVAGGAVGAAGSANRPAILAIVGGQLGRFDAVTLKPLGRTVDVGHSVFRFARSPSGTELAIVTAQPAVLRIVDLRRLKTLVKMPLSPYPADAVTWVAPRAVLVEFGGLVVY